MTNAHPFLRVVHNESAPHSGASASPISSCVAAACRGELYAFLDRKLLDFLTTYVQGAPLGDERRTQSGACGVRLAGTAQLITARTPLEQIWMAKSGATARSYRDAGHCEAQTWGAAIEEATFSWVSAWITSEIRTITHAVRAEWRDCAFEALHHAGVSEGDWEQSRRRMTFGQLRDSARQRHH